MCVVDNGGVTNLVFRAIEDDCSIITFGNSPLNMATDLGIVVTNGNVTLGLSEVQGTITSD